MADGSAEFKKYMNRIDAGVKAEVAERARKKKIKEGLVKKEKQDSGYSFWTSRGTRKLLKKIKD